MTVNRIWILSLAIVLLACTPKAFAHAMLVRSVPSNQSVVHSHQVQLTLDYNSRIDAGRSRLTLTGPAGTNVPLHRETSQKPAELRALAANLANGTYHIHWQVLASDGHITRGEIAFTVAAQ